ncbi:hypothetical protein GQ44DRAFT_818321, partial [Phaeosphaeriaceae sp. PMI808]
VRARSIYGGAALAHLKRFWAPQVAAGRCLAPALLFYGCHSSDDLMYSELFERWRRLGAVSLRHAFSQTPEKSQAANTSKTASATIELMWSSFSKLVHDIFFLCLGR